MRSKNQNRDEDQRKGANPDVCFEVVDLNQLGFSRVAQDITLGEPGAALFLQMTSNQAERQENDPHDSHHDEC